MLNHYLDGGEDGGNFGKEEAFPRPTTFYSATKQAVESLGLNYAKWCGIEFAGLRYGAVFGPWSGAGGGGPSNIIREAMRNALAGKEATVPPGAMEWVYSKDAARGTVMALDAKDLGTGVFNITMGAMTTPGEMAEAIGAVVPGAKVKFEAPPCRRSASCAVQPQTTHADLSRGEADASRLMSARSFPNAEAGGEGTQAEWMRRYMARQAGSMRTCGLAGPQFGPSGRCSAELL